MEKFGIEISNKRRARIINQNSYLYCIAYVDEQGKDLHPNAIAWISHDKFQCDREVHPKEKED